MKKRWFIDQKDLEMCSWASNYLFGRIGTAWPRNSFEDDYNYCERVIKNQWDYNTRENLLKNMQAAWRQKQYKKKQKLKGKITCSFILSATTIKKLEKLTKSFGEPLNQTLESIINETYVLDKENKKLKIAEKKQQSDQQILAASRKRRNHDRMLKLGREALG